MGFENKIDPELLEFLKSYPGLVLERSWSLEEIQERMNCLRGEEVEYSFVPDVNILVEDKIIIGPDGDLSLKIRIYQPISDSMDRPLPALLWIHGGGFVVGSVNNDDDFCQKIVLECRCVVVSVEYRLAPQHPFPAGFDDCFAALAWLASVGVNELSIDLDCIAVGGASAGGALAAGVVLRARDEVGPAIAHQMLIIPVLDDRHETQSSKDIIDPRVWNRDLSIKAWSGYLKNVEGVTPAYAAPARARDLLRLPSTFISVEEQDLLRDEAILYAQRLMQAEVRTELHVYPGTYHGSFLGVPEAGVSKRHKSDIFCSLRKAFAQSRNSIAR